MKTLKQHITEGIMDADFDVSLDPIEPVKFGIPEIDKRYQQDIRVFNQALYIPLLNEKIFAIRKLATEVAEICKDNDISISKYIRDTIDLGEFSSRYDMKTTDAVRYMNNWMGKALRTREFGAYIKSGLIYEMTFNDRNNSIIVGIWQDKPYDGINELIKKLSSIDRRVEVKCNNNQDGEQWLQIKYKY